MFPNPGQPYLPTQAPFPKIPLEEVTELEWPDTAIVSNPSALDSFRKY